MNHECRNYGQRGRKVMMKLVVKKPQIRGHFPQGKAKTRGTAPCQITLLLTYLVSGDINLIMKVLKKTQFE